MGRGAVRHAVRDDHGAIARAAQTSSGRPFWRHNPAWNQVMFSSLHLSEQNLEHYVRALREFGVEALEAYPTSAYILARFLEARNEHLPLKAVMTTGEPLFPEERRVIEERFCTKVFDQYAEAERVVFTCECERHEGHHIYEEYGITEFLNDARRAGAGGDARQDHGDNAPQHGDAAPPLHVR